MCSVRLGLGPLGELRSPQGAGALRGRSDFEGPRVGITVVTVMFWTIFLFLFLTLDDVIQDEMSLMQ